MKKTPYCLNIVAGIAFVFVMLFDVTQPQSVRVTKLTGRSGNFSSLNYPRTYPLDYAQAWQITAPRGWRVRLQFYDFHIINSQGICQQKNCGECDFVEVANGFDVNNGNLLAEYCSTKKPEPNGHIIYSTRRFLELYFQSDYRQDSGSRGFFAHYEVFNNAYDPTTLPREWTTRSFIVTVRRTAKPTSSRFGKGMYVRTIGIIVAASVIGCLVVLSICICHLKNLKRNTRRVERTRTTTVNDPNPQAEEGTTPALPGYYPSDSVFVEYSRAGGGVSALTTDDPPPSYDDALSQTIPDLNTLPVPSGGTQSANALYQYSNTAETERPPSYAEATSTS